MKAESRRILLEGVVKNAQNADWAEKLGNAYKAKLLRSWAVERAWQKGLERIGLPQEPLHEEAKSKLGR